MKLTKEQVYINLQGKSREYCQKVNDILNTNGEKTYVSKIKMYIYSNGNEKYHLSDGIWTDGDQHKAENKTEVTIEQLKEILQPMYLTIEQQLQKAEAEVKRFQSLIEEENKPKIGDWVVNNYGLIWRCGELDSRHLLKKITNKDLIKLLEQEIK